MIQSKKLLIALAPLMALAALATASPASATVICKENQTPCLSRYGSETGYATSLLTGGKAVLNVGSFKAECGKSSVNGKGTSGGGLNLTVEGKLETVSFGECGSCTAAAAVPGTFVVHHIGGTMNGNFTIKGITWSATCSGLTCAYKGDIEAGVTLEGGLSPRIKFVSASLPKESGSFLCNSTGTWTAEYTVTSPAPLWVAES